MTTERFINKLTTKQQAVYCSKH